MMISEDQLKTVNDWHQHHSPMYSGSEAAMKVNGKIEKSDLMQSLFLSYFEYGAGNEGYWAFDHLSIQFED